MNIVDNKLKCMRHQLMGSPLNRAEMLSIILYTGGDSNYDLCKSQRNGDYHKWKWFDYCLYYAINRLSKREYGSYKIYTGLSGTKLKDKHVDCGYFKTYVSTSWMRQIAETFADDTGMIFEINEEFREKAKCCDVSWISKFGISESEILIARSIDAVFNRFQCKIIDERNGVQIVSLRLYQKKEQSQRNLRNKNKKFTFENDHEQKYAYGGIDNDHEPIVIEEVTEINANSQSYGSYLVETQLEEKMKDVTKIRQEIVQMFVFHIERQLNSNCVIAKEILHLICLLCDYKEFDKGINTESLEGFSMRCTSILPVLEVLDTANVAAAAYWNIHVYAYSNYIHTWQIYIPETHVDDDEHKIMMGLQCKSAEYPSKFYGIDNKEAMYINGSFIFVPGESKIYRTYFLCYNARNKVLRICKLTKNDEFCWEAINDIEHGNYQLAFYMEGEGSKVQIKKYENTEPNILRIAIPCNNKFECMAQKFEGVYNYQKKTVPDSFRDLDIKWPDHDKESIIWSCLKNEALTELFLGYLSLKKKTHELLTIIQILYFQQHIKTLMQQHSHSKYDDLCDILKNWKPLDFYKETIKIRQYGNHDDVLTDVKTKSDLLLKGLNLEKFMKFSVSIKSCNNLGKIVLFWQRVCKQIFPTLTNICHAFVLFLSTSCHKSYPS